MRFNLKLKQEVIRLYRTRPTGKGIFMRIYLLQHGACVEKSINLEQPLSVKGKQTIDSLSSFSLFLK